MLCQHWAFCVNVVQNWFPAWRFQHVDCFLSMAVLRWWHCRGKRGWLSSWWCSHTLSTSLAPLPWRQWREAGSESLSWPDSFIHAILWVVDVQKNTNITGKPLHSATSHGRPHVSQDKKKNGIWFSHQVSKWVHLILNTPSPQKIEWLSMAFITEFSDSPSIWDIPKIPKIHQFVVSSAVSPRDHQLNGDHSHTVHPASGMLAWTDQSGVSGSRQLPTMPGNKVQYTPSAKNARTEDCSTHLLSNLSSTWCF